MPFSRAQTLFPKKYMRKVCEFWELFLSLDPPLYRDLLLFQWEETVPYKDREASSGTGNRKANVPEVGEFLGWGFTPASPTEGSLPRDWCLTVKRWHKRGSERCDKLGRRLDDPPRPLEKPPYTSRAFNRCKYTHVTCHVNLFDSRLADLFLKGQAVNSCHSMGHTELQPLNSTTVVSNKDNTDINGYSCVPRKLSWHAIKLIELSCITTCRSSWFDFLDHLKMEKPSLACWLYKSR